MSKSTPQAPPPPNPALVAQQQTGSNIDTAVAYQQTGSQSIGGVDVPTYSQTTSFNPAVQSIITGTENAIAKLPAICDLARAAIAAHTGAPFENPLFPLHGGPSEPIKRRP